MVSSVTGTRVSNVQGESVFNVQGKLVSSEDLMVKSNSSAFVQDKNPTQMDM